MYSSAGNTVNSSVRTVTIGLEGVSASVLRVMPFIPYRPYNSSKFLSLLPSLPGDRKKEWLRRNVKELPSLIGL